MLVKTHLIFHEDDDRLFGTLESKINVHLSMFALRRFPPRIDTAILYHFAQISAPLRTIGMVKQGDALVTHVTQIERMDSC